MFVFELGYYWLIFLAFILGRYFLMAGGVFFWLYPSLGRCLVQLKQWQAATTAAQNPLPQWRFIRHDIRLSTSAAVLFALLAAFIMMAYRAGYTNLYSTVDQYGWWYLGVSFGLTLMLQDTYFYFTHRLIHHPSLFRGVHRGHHRSRVPTPWTSFAFEPGEALIQGTFFVGLVFVLPLHFATLIAALLTMTVWAVITHLGTPFRLTGWPAQLINKRPISWCSRALIGPLHHGLHHRHYGVHFGLYFTFWDWLFNTTHPSYGEECRSCVSQTGKVDEPKVSRRN